jgi:hypothetical protein
MTFIQAVELMKQGKKLTHRYFSNNEWVTMQGNLTMIFEDGVKCTTQQFLMDRTDLAWAEDWEEFKK